MRNPSLPASEPINDCSACVCVGVCAVWGGWRQVGAACPSVHTWGWQWRNKNPLPWGEGDLKSCTFMLLLKHRPSRVSVALCVLNTWTFPFFPKALIFIYTSLEPFSTFKGSQHHVWQTTLEPLYALVPSDCFFYTSQMQRCFGGLKPNRVSRWMARMGICYGGHGATVADLLRASEKGNEAEVIKFMWSNQNALWVYDLRWRVCIFIHRQVFSLRWWWERKKKSLALLFLDQSTIPISCHDN